MLCTLLSLHVQGKKLAEAPDLLILVLLTEESDRLGEACPEQPEKCYVGVGVAALVLEQVLVDVVIHVGVLLMDALNLRP